MRPLPLIVCAPALAAAGCTDASRDTAAIADTTVAEDAQPPEESAADQPLPAEFIRTAWRITSEDGARYTTYLDEDGRYRDFRNGDAWQQGTWETDGSDRLCFLPDDEGAALTCWSPDRMDGADAMIASGQGGTRIKLQQVEYIPPADDDEV